MVDRIVNDVSMLITHPHALHVVESEGDVHIECRSFFEAFKHFLRSFFWGAPANDEDAVRYLKAKGIQHFDQKDLPNDPETLQKIQQVYARAFPEQHFDSKVVSPADSGRSSPTQANSYIEWVGNPLFPVEYYNPEDPNKSREEAENGFNRCFSDGSTSFTHNITINGNSITTEDFVSEQDVTSIKRAIATLPEEFQDAALTAFHQFNWTDIFTQLQANLGLEYAIGSRTIPPYNYASNTLEIDFDKRTETMTIKYGLALNELYYNNQPVEGTSGVLNRILTITRENDQYHVDVDQSFKTNSH